MKISQNYQYNILCNMNQSGSFHVICDHISVGTANALSRDNWLKGLHCMCTTICFEKLFRSFDFQINTIQYHNLLLNSIYYSDYFINTMQMEPTSSTRMLNLEFKVTSRSSMSLNWKITFHQTHQHSVLLLKTHSNHQVILSSF
jgi:hypothetical protein